MKTVLVAEDSAAGPLAALLQAYGASFRCLDPGGEALWENPSTVARQPLVISERQLIRAVQVAAAQKRNVRTLLRAYEPVLVFPFGASREGITALQHLTGGHIQTSDVSSGALVSLINADTCGPFAGLQFRSGETPIRGLDISLSEGSVELLAASQGSGLFLKVKFAEGDVFVAAANSVFDPAAEARSNLDVADCFSSLVPLLLFLRHCDVTRWKSPAHFANLMIDDPNLRPDYGFVNLTSLAACITELSAAVTIGFIPWNYRRTCADTVSLIRSHFPRLSICVHGCDHTRSEFATATVTNSLQLIALGLRRMEKMTAATGLNYDRTMIFPQGVFSAAAMQALRHGELLAAVNTELIDRESGHGIRTGELLKPAVTSYSGFPLFLRRKPDEPLVNYALDLLLGKSCLIVTHHEYFRDGMGPFVQLVHALRTLDPALHWTNLETIVSQTYSTRDNPDATVDVRLFSARTEFAGSQLLTKARFRKTEPLLEKKFNAYLDSKPLVPLREGDEIVFTGEPTSTEHHVLRVELSPRETAEPAKHSLKQRVKISTRRHLSEARDNYIVRSPKLAQAIASARKLVRGVAAATAGTNR